MMKKLDKINREQAKTESKKEKKARFTEDGLKIYSMDDLNMGKGGNTSECPFDCQCCF